MNQEKSFLSKLKTYLIFAGPTTFVFATVVIAPLLFGIYLTFTNWDGLSAHMALVGLKNYVKVVNDQSFWDSFIFTAKYVVITFVLINVLSFLLAYVLTSGMKGQNFFRGGFFTSNLIGGIVLGLIWQFVFQNILVSFGTTFHLAIFSDNWLADPTKAFWSLVIASVWQSSGYMMMIYIAGFTNVPKELIEAASVDGATGFRRMRSIILPMIMPSFTVVSFLTLKGGFMVYDVNLALTQGGPYKSTEMVSMHVYQKAFLSQQYGVGQAEAFCLFIIVAVISFAQVYISKKREVEA